MQNDLHQSNDMVFYKSRITQLERDLADSHSVITALTDLLHLQNLELRRLRQPGTSTSVKKHFSYILRRLVYKKNKALLTIPQLGEGPGINLPELHPGIQVRLKKKSFWQKYVVSTIRKIRGKPPRNKYEVYTAAFYDIDGGAGSPTRNLASRYASILSQRGL